MGKISSDSKFHTDFENVSVLNYSETSLFFQVVQFFFYKYTQWLRENDCNETT